MPDVDFVIAVHDEIFAETCGLIGFAGGGHGRVESAIQRVDNHASYAGLDDVLGIAAPYALAIAKGHVFNDVHAVQRTRYGDRHCAIGARYAKQRSPQIVPDSQER